MLRTPDVPGLDLPGIDLRAIATGYGVPAHHAGTPDALGERLRRAATERAAGPALIEVPVTGFT